MNTKDHIVVHSVFYFVSVSLTVVLMNLFIGVLGQTFELYQSQAECLFVRQRACVMVNVYTYIYIYVYIYI